MAMNENRCGDCPNLNTKACESCEFSLRLDIEDQIQHSINVCWYCGLKITQENDSRWKIPLGGGKWQSICIDCAYGINFECTECGHKGNNQGLRLYEENKDANHEEYKCPECGGKAIRTSGEPGTGRAKFDELEAKLKSEKELELVN
jgi:predicted RNA-binding Zn-ribbon protein involved in translation (DUF1610 family)